MTQPKPIHIVGLNGSPHRDGNTVTLMRWVLEGCERAGAEVEWIHLADYDVHYCQGCFTCLRTGECPIHDDFPMLRDRLVAADGIVVGSPVYEGLPTARLKTLMDRATLLGLYTRTFERQRTVGVATSGVAPTGSVARGIAELFGRPYGTIGAKTASVARGYQALAQVADPRLPARARALGCGLVADIRKPRRSDYPLLTALRFRLLFKLVVYPLVTRHPDQFGGVIRIWEEKGWLPRGGCPAGQKPVGRLA